MRTLALDLVTGDIAIAGGRLGVVEGPDAIRQQLQMRLRMWSGEWFADTSVGVPWGSILGAKGAQAFAEATLRRAISTCPGVATLDAFTFAVDARRRATVTFAVTTTAGEPLTISDFVAGDA